MGSGPAFERIMRELLGDNLPDAAGTEGLTHFLTRHGDADGDGLLSRGEFQFLTWRLREMENDLNLEADFIFTIFDANQDSKICREEFVKLFEYLSKGKGHSSLEYINSIYSELDA